MRNRTRIPLLLAAASFSLFLSAAAQPADPPDSKVNPASGFIETTDSTWVGGHYDIRHAINYGTGRNVLVTILSSDPANDLSPRLVMSLSGDTWTVWWRDAATDAVVIRKRSFASGTWGPERLVGLSNENGRNPEIVHDGLTPWVAYEIPAADGIGIGVVAISDDPNPYGRTIIGRSTFGGDVDVQIHAEGGRLWVDWVQDGTFVGWSQYDAATGAWSVASYESYAADSIGAARGRVAQR